MFILFNDTATTEIYTLSLHDALPILEGAHQVGAPFRVVLQDRGEGGVHEAAHVPALTEQQPDEAELLGAGGRSEEHTSELQSRQYLVCRLLLEKNNLCIKYYPIYTCQ